jgi:hypothetical protein
MTWQHKIQGSLPQILSSVLHRDFTEQQLRAYFTKDDSLVRQVMKSAFALSFLFAFAPVFRLAYYPWFALLCLFSLLVAGVAYLLIRLGIPIPTDEEYEAWVEKRAAQELQKGLIEIEQEDMPQAQRESLLVVRGYAVPGTKDEKHYLKEDILWKQGKDGKKHYGIYIYTYIIPLEHRIVSLTFHVNAVNFADRSTPGIAEYFYSDIVAVQAAYERERVTIEGLEYLYNTQSFLLSSSDGKGISVTIRSLPIAHEHKLPTFDFIDPRIEGTIRKTRKLVCSRKEQESIRLLAPLQTS